MDYVSGFIQEKQGFSFLPDPSNGPLSYPSVRTKLAKTSFYYNGVVIWNNIYKLGIVDEVSEFVFSRTLKKRIMRGQVWA